MVSSSWEFALLVYDSTAATGALHLDGHEEPDRLLAGSFENIVPALKSDGWELLTTSIHDGQRRCVFQRSVATTPERRC